LRIQRTQAPTRRSPETISVIRADPTGAGSVRPGTFSSVPALTGNRQTQGDATCHDPGNDRLLGRRAISLADRVETDPEAEQFGESPTTQAVTCLQHVEAECLVDDPAQLR